MFNKRLCMKYAEFVRGKLKKPEWSEESFEESFKESLKGIISS